MEGESRNLREISSHLRHLKRWAEIRIEETKQGLPIDYGVKVDGFSNDWSMCSWSKLVTLSKGFQAPWNGFQKQASAEQMHWGRTLAKNLEEYGNQKPESLIQEEVLKELIRLVDCFQQGSPINQNKSNQNQVAIESFKQTKTTKKRGRKPKVPKYTEFLVELKSNPEIGNYSSSELGKHYKCTKTAILKSDLWKQWKEVRPTFQRDPKKYTGQCDAPQVTD